MDWVQWDFCSNKQYFSPVLNSDSPNSTYLNMNLIVYEVPWSWLEFVCSQQYTSSVIFLKLSCWSRTNPSTFHFQQQPARWPICPRDAVFRNTDSWTPLSWTWQAKLVSLKTNQNQETDRFLSHSVLKFRSQHTPSDKTRNRRYLLHIPCDCSARNP